MPAETGFPRADVADEFLRVRRRQALARLVQRLRRSPDDVNVILPFDEVISALGLRGERSAVVSSARMDPGHLADGTLVDSALFHRRLIKMISREIGFLYYRLPFSPDSQSVLRESIMGVDELDEMGEEF